MRLCDCPVITKHHRNNHISARVQVFWPETLQILRTKGQISTVTLHQPASAPTAKSVTGGRKNSLCFWKSLSDWYKMFLEFVHQPKHLFLRSGFVLHSNFASQQSETEEQSGFCPSSQKFGSEQIPYSTTRPRQCQLTPCLSSWSHQGRWGKSLGVHCFLWGQDFIRI